jgi:hypothetical protein
MSSDIKPKSLGFGTSGVFKFKEKKKKNYMSNHALKKSRKERTKTPWTNAHVRRGIDEVVLAIVEQSRALWVRQ